MDISLGISNAKIVATLANKLFSYSLPLTNKGGRQIEDYEVKTIRHYVQGLDISDPTETILESVLGYRISWSFSYSDFVKGTDIEIFESILAKHKQGYTLTITPRVDNPARKFVIIPDNQTLALGINSGGYKAGNNSWVFRFITKNLEQSLGLGVVIDPDSITSGTIFGAGVLTGQGL